LARNHRIRYGFTLTDLVLGVDKFVFELDELLVSDVVLGLLCAVGLCVDGHDGDAMAIQITMWKGGRKESSRRNRMGVVAGFLCGTVGNGSSEYNFCKGAAGMSSP
jgi:hypothetical protein